MRLRPALLLAVAFASSACDEDPKKTASPSASASAAPLATAAPTATAAATATTPPPPKKIECPAGNEVAFTDKALESEIRRKLGKDGGTITKADLATVKSVTLANTTTDFLDPCVFPFLTGMKDLFLGRGEIEDLAPISELRLISFGATSTKVKDLQGLQKMTLMDRLILGGTPVSDLRPVGNMAGLTELTLDDTQVSDLSPLRACTKLERLSIKRTLVKDLSPLRDMKKLKFLYIEGAAIESVTPLDPLVGAGLRIVKAGAGGRTMP